MWYDYIDVEENDGVLIMNMKDDHRESTFYAQICPKHFLNTVTHKHDFVQINYISHGTGKHKINDNEFDITKGDIFIIPPYIQHSVIAPDINNLDIIKIDFMPEFINQNFSDNGSTDVFFDFAYLEPFLVSENQVKPRLNLIGEVRMEVEAIIDEMLHELNIKKPGYLLLIKSLLLKLLVLVGREFSNELERSAIGSIYSKHKDEIAFAIKHLNKHFTEEICLNDIAQKFFMSPSFFRRLFKSVTTNTFTEYITELRLSKAKDLLRNTNMKVMDICLDVGFNNVNHFNRLFRQYTGMTPLKYRKEKM